MLRSLQVCQIARLLGLRLFRGHWDQESLVNDSVSLAWELSQTAPSHVKPSCIAFVAVKRTRLGRQHRQSITSLTSGGKYDLRAKERNQSRQIDIALEDVASERDDPADVAGFWMDFHAWLERWDERRRAMIRALGIGGRTGEVAVQFGVSPGRVAQHRREFEDSWRDFQHN